MTRRQSKGLGIISILLAVLMVLTSFPVFAGRDNDDTGISVTQVIVTDREGRELGSPVARDLEISLGFSYRIEEGEYEGGEFVIRVPKEIVLEEQADEEFLIGYEPIVDTDAQSFPVGFSLGLYSLGESGISRVSADGLAPSIPVYATIHVDTAENTIAINTPAYVAADTTTRTIAAEGKFLLDGDTEGNTRLTFSMPSGNKGIDIFFASPDGTYISSAEINKVVDGTAPFDNDSSAGNDANSNNGIVRTFDTVSYTIGFNIASSLNLTEATVHFEFFLPYDSQTAIFDTDSMGWIEGLNQREDASGQSLTGRYTLRDNGGIVAPGSGTIEAIVKVLYAANGYEIQPELTLWLEGNSDEQKVKVTPDSVTVSAAPKYNIRIGRNTYLEYRDEFNLSKGNSKDKGYEEGDEVVEGYMHGYGIAFQLYNDNASKGLKGIEIPTGDITVDLHISLEEKSTAMGSTSNDITGEYPPILWDYKRNTPAVNGDNPGRNMIWNEYSWTSFAALQVPYVGVNSSYNNIVNKNAGKIVMEQQGNIISVTLSGYDFIDISYPTHNAAESTTDTASYGANIGTFSAGYFQLLVQVPEEVKADTNYNLTVTAENLQMKSLSGQEMQVGNQIDMNKSDDSRTHMMILKPDGKYDTRHYLTSPNIDKVNGSYYLTSSYRSGDAWSAPGDSLIIWGGLISGATNDRTDWPYAIDILQKFDDRAFLVPAGSNSEMAIKDISSGYNDMEYRVLYAAKPDGSGWTDERDLLDAGAGDLIYFTSINELTAQGYTCVALLYELRDGYMTSGSNVIMGLNMQVRNDVEIGKVYITSNAVYVWTQEYALPSDATRLATPKLEELYKTRWKRVNSQYTASIYNPDGSMGGHNGGWTYGQSLLIVGIEASLEKSIEQRSSGLEKTNFNVGQGERQVDYVLRPAVAMANGQTPVNGKTTTVTVTDTLPVDLTYIPGTAIVGGAYTEGAGVTGGTALEPEITNNADGTTTLVWKFDDVPVGQAMEEIHFSCLIGDLEDLAKDVAHNQQIVNTAVIHAVGDDRALNAKGVNKKATATLQITKLTQASLVKRVEKTRYEIGEDITYSVYFSNSSDSAVTNTVLLDVLPWNGDGRQTDLSGNYTVKDVQISLSNGNTDNLKVLYASADTARSQTPTAFDSSLFAEWAGGNQAATAIAVTGDIPALSTLTLTYTLEIDKDDPNAAGDIVSNNASIAGNGVTGTVVAPTVSSIVVGRTLSGLVWEDQDENGRRDDGETLVEGVKVTLYKNGSEVTGDILGIPYGDVFTNTNGEYRFERLPAGEYTVYFDSAGSVDLQQYGVTVYRAKGVSEERNSDAKPLRYADGTLHRAYIADIILPVAPQIGTGSYEATHLDMGLTEPGERLVSDKTSNPESGELVVDGQEITYTITIINEGVRKAENIEVTDKIPEFTSYVSDSASDNGKYDVQTGMITWTIDELKAGESKSVSFQVTVDEMEEEGTRHIANVAQVNGEDTPETEHPQEKDGPELTGVKLSNPTSGNKVQGGDVITYTILVSNSGDAVAKDVKITDTIPAYTEYRRDTASHNGQYSEEDEEIIWIIDRIETGGYVEVSFSVTVLPMEEAGSRTIRNVAQVNDKDTPGTEHPQERDYPDITIEKGSNPASGRDVVAGQEITYSIRVENSGTAPSHDVVITDTVPEFTQYVMDSETSSIDGNTFTLSEAGEDGIKLEWVLDALEPGEVWTVSFQVTVEEIEPGEARTIRNVAQVGHDGKEPEGTNETEHFQEEPLGPFLAMEKESDPISGSKVEAGDAITYRITVKNLGDETARDVVITDLVPEHTKYTDGSASHNGIYVKPGKVLVWMIGDLEPGEGATVSFQVSVEEMASAGKRAIRNVAQVGYDGKSPKDTNETEHFQEKEQGPVVNAVKSSNPASGSAVYTGDIITYTIAVTNNGDTTAEDVVITDMMPEYTDYVAGSVSDGGTYNSETGTITWELGTLEPGKTVRVSFEAKVQGNDNNTERTIRNVAQYSHDGEKQKDTNETEHPQKEKEPDPKDPDPEKPGTENPGGNGGGKDKDPGTDKPDVHNPGPGTDGGSHDRSKDFGGGIDIHDEDIPLATTLLTLLEEETPLSNIDIPDTGVWQYFWIIQLIPPLCLTIFGLLLISSAKRKEEQ